MNLFYLIYLFHQVPKSVKTEICLSDGTVVDTEEYFTSLPAQTVLVLKKNNENILTGNNLV